MCEFGFIFQKTHFSRNIVENISFFKHPLLGFFTLSIWLTGLPIKDAPLHIDPNSVAFWVNPRSRNTPWVDNILGTLDGLVRVITTPGQIFELDHVTFKLIWRCRVFFPYSTLLQNQNNWIFATNRNCQTLIIWSNIIHSSKYLVCDIWIPLTFRISCLKS